jgi:16S rRNA (uracil1498-N3)-methyltransferase
MLSSCVSRPLCGLLWREQRMHEVVPVTRLTWVAPESWNLCYVEGTPIHISLKYNMIRNMKDFPTKEAGSENPRSLSRGKSQTMRRFFIDRTNISADRAVLTGTDVRHMRTVLRLGPGDEVSLFDGQGYEYRARITDSTPQAVTLLLLDQYPARSESHLEITMAQGFLKARKMDRIVRQLTELGAFAFIPFMAERSVPRPRPGPLAERMRRWETIAREACKQCCRSRAPHVGPVVSFEDLISTRESYDLKIIFHNRESATAATSSLGTVEKVESVLALIGPEGGFTDKEVNLALDVGFVPFCLGPRVLKADTAAMAACAILQHVLGDLGGDQKSIDKD